MVDHGERVLTRADPLNALRSTAVALQRLGSVNPFANGKRLGPMLQLGVDAAKNGRPVGCSIGSKSVALSRRTAAKPRRLGEYPMR